MFSIRYIQVLRYVLQLSQESWIENRSVVPISGIWFPKLARYGQGQGLKAPTYFGAFDAALKGRSSTVVQKACSCTGFNVAFRT
jgi:hypothetical protein